MPDGASLASDVYSPRRAEGRAPLVLVHGTLVSRRDYRYFAPLLANALGAEVIVYDRRGRDALTPQAPEYSLRAEADDLDAVLAASGADKVLGHSYGGSVTLLAAGRAPGKFAWVTYDAALNPAGSLSDRWRPEFREVIDAGDLDAGWAMLVNGLGTAGLLSRLPVPVLKAAGHSMNGATGIGRRMYAALPGSLREMESVLRQDEPFPLPERGLMINGGLSPDYFHDTTAFVTGVHPRVRSLNLPGLMHNGPMLPLRALARIMAAYLVSHPANPAAPSTPPSPPSPPPVPTSKNLTNHHPSKNQES